jgi:hypothetical protein
VVFCYDELIEGILKSPTILKWPRSSNSFRARNYNEAVRRAQTATQLDPRTFALRS